MHKLAKPKTNEISTEFSTPTTDASSETNQPEADNKVVFEDDEPIGPGYVEIIHWSSRRSYIIALLALGINFENYYMFPLNVLRYGGLSFLVIYTILMFTIGFPLVFYESIMGQYFQQGPVRIWDNVPLARGLGWAVFAVAVMLAFYTNMYSAYVVLYFAHCFDSSLPWQTCHDEKTCLPRLCVLNNNTIPNMMCPGEHYFNTYILQSNSSPQLLSDGVGEIKAVHILAFFFSWFVIYLAMFQSIGALERMAKVLMVLPYFCLFMSLAMAIRLRGGSSGISHLFSLNSTEFWNYYVWTSAAQQVLFQLGLCQGTFAAYGYYCHHRNPVHRDSLLIVSTNYLTSILCAITAFATLGVLADEKSIPMQKVLDTGLGLVYFLYIETLSRTPMGNWYCAIFFLMLFCLVIGTQLSLMTTIVCTVYNEEVNLLSHRWFVNSLICGSFFISGILLCTSNGFYVTQILHDIPCTLARYPIAICTCLTVICIYKNRQLNSDIYFTTGHISGLVINYFVIMIFIIPLVLLFIMVPSILYAFDIQFGKSAFASGAIYLGWSILILILVLIISGSVVWVFYCIAAGRTDCIMKPLYKIDPNFYTSKSKAPYDQL